MQNKTAVIWDEVRRKVMRLVCIESDCEDSEVTMPEKLDVLLNPVELNNVVMAIKEWAITNYTVAISLSTAEIAENTMVQQLVDIVFRRIRNTRRALSARRRLRKKRHK